MRITGCVQLLWLARILQIMPPAEPSLSSRARRGQRGQRGHKDERRERTRQRLLQAALDLLRLEGRGALGVSAITRRVGVHHSLFYAHWKTLEDCLAVVAERVLEKLEPMDRALRRDVLARSMSDRRALASMFEATLDLWLGQRPFVELLLAHRLDQSALGQTLRPALARIRDDLAAELWNLAARLGIGGEHMPEVRLLADQFLNTLLWALELVVDGRAPDRAVLAVMLADGYLAQTKAAFGRMQTPPYEAIVAARFSPGQRRLRAQARAAWRVRIAEQDDAALVAHFGDAEAAVDAALRSACVSFLPEAARGQSAVVCYAVAVAGTTIARWFVIDRGECSVLAADDGKEPRCTLHLSLRTLLQTFTGARSYNEAFRAGDIHVEGDVLFSAEMIDWFYAP
jgi:AcrR family transcriptional regulator